MTTLDGFLGERTSLPGDWIKIDVEGYEARVLRGAAATIARCRPGLFIEVDDANLRGQGDSAGGLLKWVEGTGYEIPDAATANPSPPILRWRAATSMHSAFTPSGRWKRQGTVHPCERKT